MRWMMLVVLCGAVGCAGSPTPTPPATGAAAPAPAAKPKPGGAAMN